MSLVVVKNAFLPVSLPVSATKQAKVNGRKLFEAGHVVFCEEKGSTNGKNRVIVGAVVRQTSVNEAPVKLKIELTEERNVKEAICSCPAGESGICKHVLAIVYHCNSAATESRTSQPQRWGKPAVKTAGKQKYAKGKKAQLLFENSKSWKTDNIVPMPLPRFELLPQSSIFAKMLKTEQISAADRNVISDVSQMLEDTIRLVDQATLGEIVRNCLSLKHTIYSNLAVPSPSSDPSLTSFYSIHVMVNDHDSVSIACRTICQSECVEWHSIRKLRISASKKAHSIITSRNYARTLQSLINEKVVSHKNLEYGKKTEIIAIREYLKLTRKRVERCGIVVNPHYPWLCGSPDGIIIEPFCNCPSGILEVKCPITCRNKPIVDGDTLNVPYLEKNSHGYYGIKKSHIYFTQAQMLMYCTGTSTVDFFIYSPKGSLLIHMTRNEQFLQAKIPILERFYFEFYLPALLRK